ncbi:MAG: VCBS repeat-containing protein [Acidobacteria bacterium]|nr:VCBS repeat-containing protein [Acidobacteriota bacterium]
MYSKLKKSLLTGLSLLYLTAGLAAFADSARAATFTVVNTNDSGAGSLRQAVLDANAAAGADTIEFAFSGPQTIVLTSGELAIPGTVTVNGSPQFPITISGNNNSRIFNGNSSNSNITLNYLNITGGRVALPSGSSFGGGISSFGPLVVNNCAIYGNTVLNGPGGGIYFNDTLVMTRSTVSGNTASAGGGGITSEFNTSVGDIIDSTVAFNTAGTLGGGVQNQTGIMRARNSIIASNTGTGSRPDFSGTLTSQGYNLIGNSTGANIIGTILGNQLNVDPLLSPLALNGGATMNHALPRNSPAIDAGDPNRLQFADQRDTVRGSDGNSDGTRGGDVGAYEKLKTALDFNGDELSDIAVLRNGSINSLAGETPNGISNPVYWFFQTSPTTYNFSAFGFTDDKQVPADYDGDGKTDIAVYRPSNGTWYILGSQNGIFGFRWGISTDIPVPADYDGDGKADVAVFRAGVWYILKSQQGYTGTVSLGQAADKPVPADYDGDGKADVAVFTGTNWSIIKSGSGLTNDLFGLSGDIPVAADYDGDGKANLAVFRPSNRTWYYARNSGVPAQNFESLAFGLSTDAPAPADYDGDGKTDIAVFRNGVWYLNETHRGLQIAYFGVVGDVPIANLYAR